MAAVQDIGKKRRSRKGMRSLWLRFIVVLLVPVFALTAFAFYSSPFPSELQGLTSDLRVLARDERESSGWGFSKATAAAETSFVLRDSFESAAASIHGHLATRGFKRTGKLTDETGAVSWYLPAGSYPFTRVSLSREPEPEVQYGTTKEGVGCYLLLHTTYQPRWLDQMRITLKEQLRGLRPSPCSLAVR